jgi:DNA invertase Pin-like site-specific DNA recombinase
MIAFKIGLSWPAGLAAWFLAAVLLAVGQIGREHIGENVKRCMAVAKARGVKLGKRAKLFSKDIQALLDKGLNPTEAAKKLGVSRQAIYKAV